MRLFFKGFIGLFFTIVSAQGFAAEKIEQIYQKQCATCHGDQGDGRGRAGVSLQPQPTDFTNPEVKATLSHEQMVNAILNGVAGTSMVGYARRLDQQTAEALASYIRTQFMGRQSADEVQVSVSKPSGQALYMQHCAACHGDNGNSAVWAKNGLNPPPRNFTSEAAKQDLSRERMITSVTHGRPGTAMMSFAKRLNQTEIVAVVDFIRSEFMQLDLHTAEANALVAAPAAGEIKPPSQATTNNKMMLPFPDGLQGDASLGQAFYNKNCFTCHGKQGRGDGPRAHFNRPRPRDFTSEESRQELNRPRLFSAISDGKRGTVMPAWATVLSDQEIANVAEYVFQTFVQPQKKKNG